MEEDEEITGPRKKQVKLLKQQLVKWKEQDRNLADQLKVMHEGISKRAKRLRRREDRLLFLNTELGKKVDALLDSQAATVQIGHQEKGLIESKVQKLMAEFIVPIRNGGNIVVKPIRKEEDESAFQISERLAKEHKAEAMQQSIADLIPGAEHKMEHVDLEQKIVMVEIQFNGKVTPFHIGPQTTFAELSILASPYYSLPSEDIFFSDEPGDARGRLFIRNQVIAAELYPWRTWKMTQDAQLFIVLGGYMSVEDKIALESEESMDEYQQEEQPEIMHLIKKPDRADVDEFQEKEQKGVKLKVKKRMKKHMLCNWIQSVVYLFVVILWVTVMIWSRQPTQTAWMNYVIDNTIAGDSIRQNHDYYSTFYLPNAAQYLPLYNVHDVGQFWLFLDQIRNLMFANQQTVFMLNKGEDSLQFISLLQSIQLRQVRSKIVEWEFYDDEAACPLPYYVGNESSQDFRNFTYSEATQSKYTQGLTHIYYDNAGYITELNVLEYDDWVNKVEKLKSRNWINMGTRYIEITINAVNPQIAVASVVEMRFEFNIAGDVAPSYQIHSFSVDPYDEFSIMLYVLIQALIFVQWGILVNDLVYMPSEIDYFAKRNMPEKLHEFEPLKETLEEWEAHDKLKFCKKIRAPFAGEIINYLAFIIVTILQVARVVWWASVFEDELDLSSPHYINLTELATSFNIIHHTMGVVTVLLFCSIIKYVVFWISTVAMITDALKIAWGKTKLYNLTSLIALFAFANFFYLSYGTYMFKFNWYDFSLASVMQIFLGNWGMSNDFEPYTPTYVLIIFLGGYFIWKQLWWYILVVEMSWSLQTARKAVVATKPTDDDEEEEG